MESLREWTLRVTIILLTASVVLIGPGIAGTGSSLPFLGALLALAVVFGYLRSRLTELPRVIGHDLGTYAQDLWLGPVIALVLVGVIAPSASAKELQALGGIAGLVGMINYFIRPVYFVIIGLIRQIASKSNAETPQADPTRAPRANGDRSSEMPTSRESTSVDQQARAPNDEGAPTENSPQGKHGDAAGNMSQERGHEQTNGADESR